MKIVHNFSKIFFKTAELINLISVSRASFYRMQNKWIARGIDPKQFGKVTVQGVPLWNGPIFLKFLNEYEITLLIFHKDKSRTAFVPNIPLSGQGLLVSAELCFHHMASQTLILNILPTG